VSCNYIQMRKCCCLVLLYLELGIYEEALRWMATAKDVARVLPKNGFPLYPLVMIAVEFSKTNRIDWVI
jgi:hypothetical protein